MLLSSPWKKKADKWSREIAANSTLICSQIHLQLMMTLHLNTCSWKLELIELQCNSALKTQYQSVGAAEFAPLLPESMPRLRLHAARIMSMFGSTYSCEQMFSVMKLNKTSHSSRLTDQHLVSVWP